MLNPATLPRLIELADQLAALPGIDQRQPTISITTTPETGWVVLYSDELGIPMRHLQAMRMICDELDCRASWVRNAPLPGAIVFQPFASLEELGSPL